MDTQVIVVGAGPVGLMLAAELRLGGAEVTVLERLSAPTAESRASTLHARTMEIFDQRGLVERLGQPGSVRMGHFGGIPLDLGALPTRYPGQWKVPQSLVEDVLAARCRELGADIRREHEVTSLAVPPDRVTVRAITPAGTQELTGAYLVGCDGEESTIRCLAGIEFPGSDATRELLRADLTGVEVPARRFERLPNGMATAAVLPTGVTRVMVADHIRPAGRTAPVTFDEVIKTWERVTGDDIRGGTPVWLNAFGNASRLAARYRAGRILLAGDAAHVQMPVGGQAINLGLQDAVNLGWKLAAQVRGDAPDGLLDSYHHERHKIGQRVLSNIAAQSMLLLGDADVEPARTLLAELIGHTEVRDLLAGMISGLDVCYERGEHPLVGVRMPDLALRTEARPTSTTELLRSGRGVLLDFSGYPARQAWLTTATASCARRLDIATALAPPTECSVEGLDTVLLRPDGYVAWVSSQLSDPRPALRRWFG